jgi:hypothetical protein
MYVQKTRTPGTYKINGKFANFSLLHYQDNSYKCGLGPELDGKVKWVANRGYWLPRLDKKSETGSQ